MSLPVSCSTTCSSAHMTLVTSCLRPLFIIAILWASRLHWIHRIHGRTAPRLHRSAAYTIPVLVATSSLSRIGVAVIVKVFYNAIRIVEIPIRDYFDFVHLVLICRNLIRILKFLFGYWSKFVVFHHLWRCTPSFPILFVAWSSPGLRTIRLFCLDCSITPKYLSRIQVRILVCKYLTLAFRVSLNSTWHRWWEYMINEAWLMRPTGFFCVEKRSRGLLRKILVVRWRSAFGISYRHGARSFLLCSNRGTFANFLGLILNRLVQRVRHIMVRLFRLRFRLSYALISVELVTQSIFEAIRDVWNLRQIRGLVDLIYPLRALDPIIAWNAELLVGSVRRRTQILPVAEFVLFTASLGRGPKMVSALLFDVGIQHVIIDVLSPSPLQTWMSGMILVCDSIIWFPLKKDDVILVFIRVLFHRVWELITLVIVIHSIDRAKPFFA